MYNVFMPQQWGQQMGNGPQAMQGGMNGPQAMGSPMNGQNAMGMPQMPMQQPQEAPQAGGMNPMAMMAMQGGQQMMGQGNEAAQQEMMRRQQMNGDAMQRMQRWLRQCAREWVTDDSSIRNRVHQSPSGMA